MDGKVIESKTGRTYKGKARLSQMVNVSLCMAMLDFCFVPYSGVD
ncbi:hypothetical protein [Acinetobacter parvus]